MNSIVLPRSNARCRHGVDPLGRSAGDGASVRPGVRVAEAAELTGWADVVPEHPATAIVSNVMTAATARCPLTWDCSFREPLRHATLIRADAETVPCVGKSLMPAASSASTRRAVPM